MDNNNVQLSINRDLRWKISEAWDFDALLGNEIVQDNNKYYWQYGGTYNFPGWNHINNTVTKDNEEKQSSNVQ